MAERVRRVQKAETNAEKHARFGITIRGTLARLHAARMLQLSRRLSAHEKGASDERDDT